MIQKPYKLKQVAEMLGISRTTVQKLIKENKIGHIKVTDQLFLVPQEAFEAYVNSYKTEQFNG